MIDMKRIVTFLLLLMATTAVCHAADTWTVAGTAAALNGTADWAPTNTANDMTTSDDVNYTLTVTNCTLEKGVTYQYKVVKNHAWSEAYPTSNKTFSVNETAIYTVEYTFNATTHAVNQTTTKTGEAGEVTHTYSLAGTPAEVFGAEWSETNTTTDMTLVGDLYTWKKEGVTLEAKTQVKFKVVVDHAWGQAYPAQDMVKTIDADGIYDLTFTFNATSKAVDCTIEKKGDANIERSYVVAGSSETLFGKSWDGTLAANKMTKNTDGLWEKTYADVTLTAGQISWKVVKNDSIWIPDGMDNNKTVYIPEDGIYTLTFLFTEETSTLEAKLYQNGEEIIVTPTGEGWPANYGGVMLQGFYWNSFEDTKWANLEAKANEICKYFDIVWVPNSGATGGEGMGYMPVYWFNHNSNFGRQKALKKMIQTFNGLGTKVIEDVVINHKAPKGANESWVDFVNEKWTHDGITEELNWTPADICRNDDGGYTNTVGASADMKELNGGWECTGADDTGDDFSGGRDLDHTGANVQKNCILYLNFLQKELGYSGYRLDMVKGYSAYYTGLYNKATQPEFCVGEYWDGKDAITNWIAGTGMTSAAFDFPFKYKLNEAFGGGNWEALNDKGLSGDPYWQRYSVSFIDNHDTYENEGRLVGNVLGANAFILAMPGTPCVFMKHWQRYPIAIGNMILARKAAGITNQSEILEQKAVDGGYVLKVKGTNGTVLCLAGNPAVDLTDYQIIAKGTGFAYCVSKNVTVEGQQEGNDDEEEKDITVYIEATEAPYVYAWNSVGDPVNGTWPGTKMTTTANVDNKSFWTVEFKKVPVNIIINNGDEKDLVQSADIENLKHDSYFTFDATVADKTKNWTDITSQYFTPEPVELPACALPIEGHVYCYFQGNKDYDSPRAWVWNEEVNFCANQEWPGDKMTRAGEDNNGHVIWLWDGGETEELSSMPEMILFSNNGSPQTDNFQFVVGGYYDATGLVGNVNDAQGIEAVTVVNKVSQYTYNLSGQRVNANYRGLVIKEGKKLIAR